MPVPQTSFGRIPTDPGLRGDVPVSAVLAEDTLNAGVQYTKINDDFIVFVEVGSDSTLLRVLPKFYLYVDEPAPLPPLNSDLPPLCVPSVSFVAVRDEEHYYWAVLQGRRVGIFYATVYVLPSCLCLHILIFL